VRNEWSKKEKLAKHLIKIFLVQCLAIDFEVRRVIGAASRVGRLACILARIAGSHRADGQGAYSIARVGNQNVRIAELIDGFSLEEPLDSEWSVALLHHATDHHQVTRVGKLLAKSERKNLGQDCKAITTTRELDRTVKKSDLNKIELKDNNKV